jgi:tRNA nucleotidyltransferase (CCA-adding enzyme)
LERQLDIILTHERTDFDALASMLAAARLFPEAIPVLPRQMNRNVRDFLALYKNHFRFVTPDEMPRGKVRRAIIVDTRAANSPKGTQPDTEYIVIDHHTALAEAHVINEARRASTPARELWCGATGANTTLLVEKLIEHGILISPVEATLLALGIYEDTGNLTYASTTHRDAAALAWLLEPERGVNLNEVNEFLHHPITDEQRDLLQALMDNCEFLDIAGHRIIIAITSAHGFGDELSTLAARLRDFHEPDALFIVIDLGDMIQVVARSTTDAVDVGRIAQALGGGGHDRAAAAHMRGTSLAELHDQIVELVKAHSRAAGTVRQIMSVGRPQVLSPGMPVARASELMRRWGHEGFPVVETADGHDRLLGVLTRREADRALDHGLGDQPVHRFMRAGRVAVRPDDSITLLRKTMIESNWGQIPVVDEAGTIVGIVTRTDLIKLWDEANLQERRMADTAARLQRALSPVQHNLLKLIGAEVDRMRYAVYVVGGFVRDLMLEQPAAAAASRPLRSLAVDVDIVIEGDAIAFAHRMQKRYGGRVVEHKRFGTAKWILNDEDAPDHYARLLKALEGDDARGDLPPHLDFVTARTEFYTEPAVLPTVQQSSIKLDLHRRDFTINTLALSLNPDRWGELLDFWGGLNDLRAGLVRVLHSLSFVDDATRILRAVRYEQRFRFQIETRTLELLHDARELLDRVTPARIRHELERILQEEQPEHAMQRLDELGVLHQLHPDLYMDATAAARFVRLRAQLAAPGADPELAAHPIVLLYWAIIIYPLPRTALSGLQERLGLRSETRRLMTDMHRLHANLGLLADPATPPSGIVRVLDAVTPAALALLPVVCDDPQVLTAVERYRSEWRHVRAELDGHDLRRLGVPKGSIYRAILAQLRDGRLDDTVHSRDDEIDLVRQIAAIE